MRVARPTRVKPPENKEPLTPPEATALYDEMTEWYFDSGNGMMLTNATKEMYLNAKERLGLYAAASDPAGAEWRAAGARRMRELSLLRTQMKPDLSIYGVFYFGKLDGQDEAFLEACGFDPNYWGRPWYQRIRALYASRHGQTAARR
jgi:hypothetical protein